MDIADRPNKAKYVAWIRACRAAFARVPDGTALRFGYDREMARAEWEGWTWRALNARINSRGGLDTCRCRTCRDENEMMRYRRDQMALHDIHARIRVYGFETKRVKQRFGHLLSKYDD